MRTRLWSMTAAALAALAAIAAAPGCTHRNPDINTITDKYERKADFRPDDVWLYRSSVIDTAASSSMWNGTIADGDWLVVERLRWEVTETMLIGYRDFSGVKGAEGDQAAGAYEVYEGAPVAMFPITDHFDIRRNYDPITGEETNVIGQNRDRPWYEREYMSVNWSANMVPTYSFHIMLEQLSDRYVVLENDPADPKRWRFEKDPVGNLEYFEVTTRSEVMPDLYSLYGFNGPGFMYDPASMLVDIRHSFVKARPNDLTDFETLHVPDSVVLTDAEGREVRDEHGLAKRVPINDRFGLFSTFGRRGWDPNRGITDAGRQNYGTIFNIWERTIDDDGAVIPPHLRTPKPIHYYTNVTHPKQLLSASIERVGGEWNKAFKEAVFHAQTLDVPAADRPYQSVDDVPDMFIVHENSCNPTAVHDLLDTLPAEIQTNVMLSAQEPELNQDGEMLFDGSIHSVVERYDWANSYDNTDPFTVRQALETQALEDLERICSALEFYTDPAISGRPDVAQFKYQRFGDLRYNMLNLIMQQHNNGWLGLGPMLADPLTGQTINANANIAVVHLDTAVERLTQMVDAMNGLIDRGDLISGMDIEAYMADKLAVSKQLTSQKPSEELRSKMSSRLAGLGPAHEALREISPTYPQDRMARLAGTPYESLLVSPEDAIAFGVTDPTAFMTGEMPMEEALLEEVSPARDGLYKKRWEAREQMIARLGLHMMDTPEFLDRFGWSVALRLKDEADRRKRAEKIREELYVAVQLHEVGHNVGMMHNFEASSDALNYGPRFWQLQQYPTDPVQALADSSIPAEDRAVIDSCITEMEATNERLEAEGYGSRAEFTTQECLGQQETMYSSIMEYHGTWNGDFNGLGNYDKAFIKFAYGRLLEVFPEENLNINPTSETDIRQWTLYNDWREMGSELLNSPEAINDREHIRFEWGPASTRMEPPANTVPYRFCWGAYPTPQCAPGDFGPDMRSQAQFLMTRFYNYYFFSHFNRGRLWDYFSGSGIDGAIMSDQAILADFTRKMQWYVYQSMTDPAFKGTYAEEDFLQTTIIGLNHFAAVLGQPGSGHYVSVPNYQVEDLADLTPADDLLAPSNIMVAWDWQGQCEALHLAEVDDNGIPTAPNPGYQLGYVPLGDGRPFFLGFTEDYEDWYIRYVGNYWAKWDALFYLGYNRAWFPRSNADSDPRVFDISWYRLFPEEVGGVIADIVLQRDHMRGPVVDGDGNVQPAMLIDPATGERPDYSGQQRVLPSFAFYHQYLAMAYAHAFMSSPFDDETDFLKSFKVAVEGATDDFGAFEYLIDQAEANGEDPSMYVSEFVHPHSGQRLRALNTGNNPVAYEMLRKATLSKDRYQALDDCVADPDGLAQTESYCSCVQVVEERPNGRYCTDPYLQAPGTGECAFYDLERRADRSRERMDDAVDFVDDMRGFNVIFSEW